MTTLDEKTRDIMDSTSKEFNALLYEERKRIGKYLDYQKILTLWQMINKDRDMTTEAWRKKQLAWLKSCVSSFQHDYDMYGAGFEDDEE